jgi:hypothetical protein
MFCSSPFHIKVLNWVQRIELRKNSIEKLQGKEWFFYIKTGELRQMARIYHNRQREAYGERGGKWRYHLNHSHIW